MRTFVAVELEPGLREPLLRLLQQEFPRDRAVRWCTEDQLHVTLKFLGELRAPQIQPVCDAVRQASAQLATFTIRLAGLGAFPSARSPRVLWCGIDDPAGGCRRWVELADPLLVNLGFAPEKRAFTPHVTLGRSRSPGGERVLRAVLESVAAPPPREMCVDRVVVYESRLLPTGAQYRPVFTAALTHHT